MLRVILIIIIFIILYKIYLIKYSDSNSTVSSEGFINITNPFVSGLSQFQLGTPRPDKTQMLVDLPDDYDELSEYTLPDVDVADEDFSETDYRVNPNNVLNKENLLLLNTLIQRHTTQNQFRLVDLMIF